MARRLKLTKFKHLNINDPFFDSLKAGYHDFPVWFGRKSEEDLYIVDDDGRVSGMIYLKDEIGPVTDVDPPLPDRRWMKVGTLKIEGRGTKLGERVLKKVFDTALDRNLDGIYVTVFDVHQDLIRLFERYGFKHHANKATDDGVEIVLVRDFSDTSGSTLSNYPLIKISDKKHWLLAVYPEYHSRLLPDSILTNESDEIVKDVSYTNTIHKIYIGGVPLTRMSVGDTVVIYRTSDKKAPAYYRSVATSVGIVEEVKSRANFSSVDEFVRYASPHSVFTDEELADKFNKSSRLYTARFTYNAAFTKKMTRGRLLDEVGLSEQPRWDFRELSTHQLRDILRLGNVNERIVID